MNCIEVGGSLNYYGMTASKANLFRLNADGSWDNSFDAGGYIYATQSAYGIDNIVRAISVDADGKILVGGDFTAPRNHIARLNPDGSEDTTFDPGSGANGKVTHISRQSTGAIIIGGAFSRVNGTAKAGIARLSANGALDVNAFGAGVVGGSLLALTVQADDKILAGGDFTTAAGQAASKLVRFNADGTWDSAFQPIINDSSLIGAYLHQITSLTATASYVFVGGWNPVMYFNNSPTDHNAAIYVLNIITGSFYSYMNFKGKPTDVWALAKRSDGLVMAGGSFTRRDDFQHEELFPGLCLLTGQYWQPNASFKPVIGGQADIRALAIQPDGKIIAGGSFYIVGGVAKNGVARLNADGTLDATLTVPAVSGGTVTDVLVRDDGKLVMGGSFYNIAGQDYRDVALLSPTGALEAGAYAGGVNDLAFYPGNKILVGGSFFSFSGVPRQNIVRLNADGSLDSGFSSPAFTVFNFRSEVFSVALQADGKILLAGRFSTVGGVTTPTLARLNPDGTVDADFHTPFLDQGATAYKVFVQADGKILVGGGIQIIEGANIYNSLVRLNADGSRDTSFNTSITGNVMSILAIPATSDGGQILVGGTIETVDGAARQGIARYVASPTLGNVNQDQVIDLADAILALQVTTGQVSLPVYKEADVDGDHRIGLAEAIYVLQKIADLR
jgi:uncharacterized delta-60 repeat protein